jgi:hypothetical protein
MNRLHKIERLLAAGGIVLLNLTAMPQPFTSALPIAPVLAQSTPADNSPRTTAPAPTQDDDSGISPLWLLLPVVGGLLLLVGNRRSRSTTTGDTIMDDDRVEPIIQKASASPNSFPDEQSWTPDNSRQNLDSFPAEQPLVPSNTHHRANAAPVSQQSEQTIQLLEERLVVDLHQRKVGELIVRKEIETQIIEIPIRREKLIVEQVNPKFKQLAVIDLGQEQQIDPVNTHQTGFLPTVEAKFTSPTAAMQFLQEIADRFSETDAVTTTNSGLQQIQMNIVLTDAKALAIYHRVSEQHRSNPPSPLNKS